MKKIKMFFIVLVSLLVAGSFAACGGGGGGNDGLPTIYEVTFNSGSGPEVSQYTDIAKGSKINAPDEPAYTGYYIDGWYKEAQFINRWDWNTDTVLGNITLFAKWAPITYTVNYYKNKPDSASGEVTGITAATSHTYGVSKNLASSGYSLAGYVFTGWNTSPEGTGTGYAAGAGVQNLIAVNNGTVSLYAKWAANLNTVSFNANGGSGDMPDQKINTDASTELTINSFIKTGYKFAGWATQSNGAAIYADGAVFSMTAEAAVVLYAKWNPINYTVVYYANGGNGTAMGSSSHSYDEAKALSANTYTSNKTGYLFSGWNTSENGSGTPYTDGQSVSNLAVTDGVAVQIYAQWTTAVSYTILYNKNKPAGASGGVEGEMSGSLHTYDADKALTANGFSLTGWQFTGWNTNANGSGTPYTDGQSVKNLSATQSASVVLYAQWSAKTYSITYNKNKPAGASGDIEGDMSGSLHTYDADKALTANGFSLTGWQFTGWNTNANGSGTPYTDGQSVKNLSVTQNASVILYAQWEAEGFKVEFNKNGGSGDAEEKTVYYDSPYGVLPVIEKTGYSFEGWWTGEGGTGEAVTGGTVVSVTKNHILYAKFEIIDYDLTLSAENGKVKIGGGSYGYEAGGKYNYNDQITIYAQADSGYRFTGWYANNTRISQNTEYTFTAPANSLAYTAKFEIVYNVAAAHDGGAVTGAGQYAFGETVSLTATANPNHTFLGWYKDGALITANLTYSFTMPESNINLKAWFAENFAGAGTENSPYVIGTAAQLFRFASLVNGGTNYSGVYFVLNKDIDLESVAWTPIGTIGSSALTFSGTFDGRGYTVKGLKIISSADYAILGLFGGNRGTVTNLSVEEFFISATGAGVYAGGVAGRNMSGGRIINCTSDGELITTKGGGNLYAGLLAGINEGAVINCSATGRINASADSGNVRTGGLVGNNDNNAVIVNSYAYNTDIIAAGVGASVFAGGLAGRNDASTILNCYFSGSVTATTLSATGTAYAGGITGYSSNSAANYTYSVIKNCFTSVKLKSHIAGSDITNARAGYLMGYDYQTDYSNCYYDTDSTVERISSSASQNTIYGITGTATSAANLKSAEWVKTNLWKTESRIWLFEDEGFPVPDYDYINSAKIDISSSAELKELSGGILTLNYRLTADLNLGAAEWAPIIISCGIFDGAGFTVSNFKITSETTGSGSYWLNRLGLFGINAGIVKNLNVADCQINLNYTKYTYAGGLAGLNMGIITGCSSSCEVTIKRTTTTSSYSVYAGGLIGLNKGFAVTNSFASGAVSIDSAGNDSAYAGGLLGGSQGGIIINCRASGNISAKAATLADAGGLAGNSKSDTSLSYATGTVNAAAATARAGGFAGYSDSRVENCYAKGTVTASSASTAAYAGGFAGMAETSSILLYCYATGNVISTASSAAAKATAGGLVGYNYIGSAVSGGKITSCYATGNVTSSGAATANSLVGGLIGDPYSTNSSYVNGMITNSYRLSNQTITRIYGVNTSTTGSNSYGVTKAPADFSTIALYTATLGFSSSVWDFSGYLSYSSGPVLIVV